MEIKEGPDIVRPSTHTASDHYRPTSETPFEWRLAGGPIVVGECMLAEV